MIAGVFAGCSAARDSAASAPMYNSGSMSSTTTGGAAPSAPKESLDYAADMEMDMDMGKGEIVTEDAYFDTSTSSDSVLSELAADAGRKLIWRGSMDLETLEYEASEEALFKLVAECGGYIESSSRSGGNINRYSGVRSMRYANFSVRIPAEKFQYFINAGGTVGTVLYTSTGSEDVTDAYFDTEARLTVLRVKEERLLEMLEKGDELEYLIQIETELANTRYEIEMLTGTLRRYDGLISYSTVQVNLSEVSKPTEIVQPDPLTVWERIARRFGDSLGDIWDGIVEGFIFIVGYSPIIVLWVGGIAVAIIVIRIPFRRRKKRKLAAKAAAETENSSEQ